MISKINWPFSFEKGNPFGGVDGFRPIRITFHNSSFTNMAGDEKKALDILVGLSKLDEVDAMSFDGSVSPKIVINYDNGYDYDNEIENDNKGFIGLKVVNSEEETIRFSVGVSKSSLKPSYLKNLLGIYSYNEVEKNQAIRKEVLEAKSHGALHRDIFITSSEFLLDKKEKLDDLNIRTPKEALKIIGLYLRTKGEFEWISHIKGNTRFSTSRGIFYEYLSKGLLPNCWKYLRGLGLHKKRNDLLPLGWSAMNRFSRALQARDEIARLFYMPNNFSSEDLMGYHFDYLTLLLTAVLDVQALIINEIYNLGLRDYFCSIRREDFKNAIEKKSSTNNLDSLLTAKENLINILFDLRNKIHSISLDTNFNVPETDPDELLERIYQYDQKNHWGIRKQNLTVVVNRGDPVPSVDYSVDLYNLSYCLLHETTQLINSIMEETKIEELLDSKLKSEILSSPPSDELLFIQTYLLLA